MNLQIEIESAAIDLYTRIHDLTGHDISELQIVEPGCDLVCTCGFRICVSIEEGDCP